MNSEHLTQGQIAQDAPDSMGSGGFPGNEIRLFRQVTEMFDEDKDGRINAEEGKAMMDFIRKNN